MVVWRIFTAYFYRSPNNIYFICPRGVMDNTEDSGSSAGGSIPSEGVTTIDLPLICKIN